MNIDDKFDKIINLNCISRQKNLGGELNHRVVCLQQMFLRWFGVGLSFNSKNKSEVMCEISFCICRSTIEPKAPHQLLSLLSATFVTYLYKQVLIKRGLFHCLVFKR